MEYIKWKTYIIIAFIDLLSVYLAVGLLMGIHCSLLIGVLVAQIFANFLNFYF